MTTKGETDMPDQRMVWEDPPAPKRWQQGGVRKWEGRLAPLKDHPGKWAKFGPFSTSVVARLRKSEIAGVDGTLYEFRLSTEGVTRRGHGFVYARYVGPEGS